MPVSLFSGVYFYKQYVINFLVHKSKGIYFRHSLTNFDFSDFPAYGTLDGKGPAPSRHWRNNMRGKSQVIAYIKERSSSHLNTHTH